MPLSALTITVATSEEHDRDRDQRDRDDRGAARDAERADPDGDEHRDEHRAGRDRPAPMMFSPQVCFSSVPERLSAFTGPTSSNTMIGTVRNVTTLHAAPIRLPMMLPDDPEPLLDGLDDPR